MAASKPVVKDKKPASKPEMWQARAVAAWKIRRDILRNPRSDTREYLNDLLRKLIFQILEIETLEIPSTGVYQLTINDYTYNFVLIESATFPGSYSLAVAAPCEGPQCYRIAYRPIYTRADWGHAATEWEPRCKEHHQQERKDIKGQYIGRRIDNPDYEPQDTRHICPECTGCYLNAVLSEYSEWARQNDIPSLRYEGKRMELFVCPDAIGELAYDAQKRTRYMPKGSRHTSVIYYAEDAAGKLVELPETYLQRSAMMIERNQTRKEQEANASK